jgi:hypothetical protein
MNIIEKQRYYNMILEARNSYSNQADYYRETTKLFDDLLDKINDDLQSSKQTLEDSSRIMCEKLNKNDLGFRKHFIEVNKFNVNDLEKLSGIISRELMFDSPTIELFPGTGQFLPYAVASEPLYIYDRYMDICDIAAKAVNNDLYVKRRLRKYDAYHTLPKNAFNLVYCFNEFFYADTDYVYETSKKAMELLHAGGKYIFNFLPNDQEWAIEFNKLGHFSVIDYKKVIDLMVADGWELMNCELQPIKSSHIMMRKPGKFIPKYKISGGVAEIIDIDPSIL